VGTRRPRSTYSRRRLLRFWKKRCHPQPGRYQAGYRRLLQRHRGIDLEEF
jgi:hypothetical protein